MEFWSLVFLKHAHRRILAVDANTSIAGHPHEINSERTILDAFGLFRIYYLVYLIAGVNATMHVKINHGSECDFKTTLLAKALGKENGDRETEYVDGRTLGAGLWWVSAKDDGIFTSNYAEFVLDKIFVTRAIGTPVTP